MIRLEFPPLEKCLAKNTKEMEADDPKRGVMVMKGHAMVVRENFIVVFNLKDYFVHKFNINTDDSLKTLDNILNFMDGKMFYVPYWKELVKGGIMEVRNQVLEMDGALRKDLFYEEAMFDATSVFELLENVVMKDAHTASRTVVALDGFLQMMNDLKSFVGSDSLVLEAVGVNTMMRYTFDNNPWIFGLVDSNPFLINKNFMFTRMLSFYNLITK